MHAHFSLNEARVLAPRSVTDVNPYQNCGAELDTFVDPLEEIIHIAKVGIQLGDNKCVVVPMILSPSLQGLVKVPFDNRLAAGTRI